MPSRAFVITALAVAAVAAVFAFISPAQAQMSCGNRDAMVEALSRKYGEIRLGAGLAGQAVLFEVWASSATGTWTILKTYPNGVACVIAVGDHWQDDPRKWTPTGSSA